MVLTKPGNGGPVNRDLLSGNPTEYLHNYIPFVKRFLTECYFLLILVFLIYLSHIMEFTFRINSDRQFIVEHYQGEVTKDELLHVLSSVMDDPAYQPSFDGLLDLRLTIEYLKF